MKRLTYLILAVFLPVIMWAQGTTSRIAGVVIDKTGAVISGATVIATNEGTQVSYTTKTSATGTYVFDSIQIGTYSVRADYAGFKKSVSTGNTLTIGVPLTVNVVLEVGASGDGPPQACRPRGAPAAMDRPTASCTAPSQITRR